MHRSQQEAQASFEQARVQVGIRQAADTDRQVSALFQQINQGFTGHQLKLDARIMRAEFSHQRHQLMQDKRAGRIDAQLAGWLRR